MLKEQNIEGAINSYNEATARKKEIEQERLDIEENFQRKKSKYEAFHRIGEKLKTHGEFIMKNYLVLRSETDKLNDFYKELVGDNWDKDNFDFIALEAALDRAIAEDIKRVQAIEKTKEQEKMNFRKQIDDLFSTTLKK